jgi:hypothetical protein
MKSWRWLIQLRNRLRDRSKLKVRELLKSLTVDEIY